MEVTLFNLNDLALLLVIAECLLLSGMLLIHAKQHVDRLLLAAVFVCFAVDSFSTLAYWCAPLKNLAPAFFTQTFLWGKWAYMLLGPAIYGYACLLLGKIIGPERVYIHVGLTLCYPLLLILFLSGLDPAQQTQYQFDYQIMLASPVFKLGLWLIGLTPLAYSLLTLRLYKQYQQQLEERFSNLQAVERQWIKFVLYGFVLATVWHVLTLVTAYLPGQLSHWIGLSGNWGRFVFANILIYLALEKSMQKVNEPSLKAQDPNPNTPDSIQKVQDPVSKTEEANHESIIDIEALILKIRQDQIYLSPDLTLEQLAAATHLPARALSTATNSQLKLNFFEFINGFRVEHAKKLLVTHPDLSVQRVFEDAGFSSKSAFHRFFKKATGMSPSEYRKNKLEEK